MATNRESIRTLLKTVLARLENDGAIAMDAKARTTVIDELFAKVGASIMTDQDVREQTLAKLGQGASALEDSSISDSDQFKTAKSIVMKSLGDDVLNGLYFQKPLKTVAQDVVQFLMKSKHVEEVFDSDQDLERKIVGTVQRFNPDHAH